MVQWQRDYVSDPRSVRDMRAFVREGCRQVWSEMSDDAALEELELAVSEAATNIILHGYHGEPNRPIELAVTVDDDQAQVTFRHLGDDFDPQSVPPPNFDASSESGYGMYLIQQSVDEVDYSRDEAGRCGIRLIKHRK